MPLSEQLARLATFPPTALPVISLYLNAEPNEHGRDQWQPFVRKALAERVDTFPNAPLNVPASSTIRSCRGATRVA